LKNGRAHRLVRAAEHLRSVARDVLLIPTIGPRTAGALAVKAIEDGANLIIAAGGDGTISEVVNGMANSHVPLGILPAGTANVLAHEIGLKRNVISAARQMADCSPRRVSIGEIVMASGEIRYFLMMAGAGFDAKVIYHLSAGLKDKLGKASYFLGGLRRLGGTLAELDVIIDGRRRRCTFALITKVRNYGGDFEIAAEVMLTDDQFEVILFEGQNSWRYLRYLFGVATKRLKNTPGVCFIRTGCVELRAVNESVHLQADGEYIGGLPIDIRVVPDALTLLLPNREPRRFRRESPEEVQAGLSRR
jgi:YegS/Rv2252/BmrU family lipid kinase